jgi:hypothetical protein
MRQTPSMKSLGKAGPRERRKDRNLTTKAQTHEADTKKSHWIFV